VNQSRNSRLADAKIGDCDDLPRFITLEP